jgi:hypothetical protein
LDGAHGVSIDDANDVTIFMVGQDPDLISRIDQMLGSSIHAQYVQVTKSAQDLRTLAQRVVADATTLSADTVSIEQLTPDAVQGTVDVYLETPPSATSTVASAASVSNAQAVLDSHYGAGLLTVEPTTVSAPVALDSTCPSGCRTDDYPPFYGGDSFTFALSGGQHGCSTGFSVIDSNGKFGELSAGHCATPGETTAINCDPPDQGTYCPVRTLGSVGPTFVPPNEGIDYEVIDVSNAAPYVYGGSPTNTNPPDYEVEGTVAEPTGGCCLTVDGAQSGETTGNKVVSEWTCLGGVCDLGEVQNNSNTNLGICRHGDSGGPVYEHTTGNVILAQGIIQSGNRSLDGTSFTECFFTELAEVFVASPGVQIID